MSCSEVLSSPAPVFTPPVRGPVLLARGLANVRFICVNGILSNPGDAEGWTDRAVTWLNLHTEGKAEKFEYAAGALTRRLRQDWRADAITRMAAFYIEAGCEVVFIGHSNGCDLIERVLGKLWPAEIRSVHLFAAACDGEEVARAVDEQKLGAAHLYGSANDKALALAAFSRRAFGWAGLGYGDLGRRTEEFASDRNGTGIVPPAIFAHRDDSKGHGDWFTRGQNFERTMRAILNHETTTA